MTKKKEVFIANWKMNQSKGETQSFLDQFINNYHSNDTKEVVICPPLVYLDDVNQRIQKAGNLFLGAQVVNQYDKGAYTGEVSASMLLDTGCQYVIIGHSERRQYFGETDDIVREKIMTTLKRGLIPVFCVGESLAQRASNETEGHITQQLNAVLKDEEIRASLLSGSKLYIAYEPIWAIGTGKVATPEQAQTVHAVNLCFEGHL